MKLERSNTIKIIFWNVNSKDLTNYLNEAITQENPDIIILAEAELINSLNSYTELNKTGFRVKNNTKELRYFFKKSKDLRCFDIEESSRTMIKKIEILINGSTENILIIPVHLPSKLSSGQLTSINSIFTVLEQKLVNLKKIHNTKKVIYIGDFNLNPYEFEEIYSIGTSNCLNHTAATTTSHGFEKVIYYNPNFHMLGNFNQNILGSFYHEKNWCVLDQVLMTKDLKTYFDQSSLKILELPNKTLVQNKKPKISDHMPICFEYNF